MEHTFLKQATTGKNDWWRYALTILATVAGVIIANLGIKQVLPFYKSLFPDNQFGKDLGTSILIGVIFLIALVAFIFASKKLHQRSVVSMIHLDKRFNWGLYIKGFLVWGTLLFSGALMVDFDILQAFIKNVQLTHFLILFAVGFITIGIQSFFEELVIRGYLLQGMHLKIKNITILIICNSLIFGILHFGYGIGSFIHSFTFGIAFALIVIKQHRIEFASGAHNANNLLLSLVFLDIGEAIQEEFSWTIDWTEMSIHLITISLLVAIVYKFFKK
jgi:membrane protease YdiL (CAAX protease family)